MTDLDAIVEKLERWKTAIENAIASVTALRGIEAIVPPSSSRPANAGTVRKTTTKKRVISPEGRKRIAEASRRRWANLKKSSATAKKAVRKQPKKT